MNDSPYKSLTKTQAAHFLERGFVILQNCFSPEEAAERRAFAFKRLGYDQDDPSTWADDRVHLPGMNRFPIREFAPEAWAAICDLLGGEERIADPNASWGDGFIINFSVGADRPWEPPSPDSPGWHKDGDFFRHFLNSPEQGLLTIVIWSDIEPKSGGTFVACDSVKPITELLAEHPEGLLPGPHFGAQVKACSDFVEMTGRAGDVVLMHPFILHAQSQNPSGRPRFITNPPVSLRDPMCFNRENGAYSLVEQAILNALETDHYEFLQTAPFERLHPERERIQAKMLAEQQARLKTE